MKKKHTSIGAILFAFCAMSILTTGNAHAWGLSIFTDSIKGAVETAGGGIEEIGRGAVKVASDAKGWVKDVPKKVKKCDNCVQILGVFGREYYDTKYDINNIIGAAESPEQPVNYPAIPMNATKYVREDIANADA